MADVKWIKLSTNMFDDEKIRIIEKMPESDMILIIWIKLLAQAGRVNASGYIFLSETIPYTEEMLATILDRPIGTVRLALETFKRFGMIDIDDNDFICINNWEKHQNIAGLEKIREQTRERVARHRDKKKLEKPKKEGNVTVTKSNGTELELEEELDKELELDKDNNNNIREIINFWDSNGFGYNNMQAKESLLLWLDDSQFKGPKEMIMEAMNIACSNNKRTLNYVQGILKNWQNSSLLTIEEVKNSDSKKKKSAGMEYDPNKDAF